MSADERGTQVQESEAGWVTAPTPDPRIADDSFRIEDIEAGPRPRHLGPRLLAGLLILLALGWIGASIYALTSAWPGPSLPAWIGWAGTFSAPLVLLGLVWLMFGRIGAARDAAFHRRR